MVRKGKFKVESIYAESYRFKHMRLKLHSLLRPRKWRSARTVGSYMFCFIMKKLNSFEDLKSLIPKDYKSEKIIKPKSNIKKQTLEAHYSVKGRAGTPVIIIKGFNGVNKDELKKLSKSIKNRLGIGGSIKNNEVYFQGNKRDQIISILKSHGHTVKRIGG